MTMSTLAELPVRVDPAHWIESLDGIAQATTLHRWVEQPRFRQRLIERLRRRHDLADLEELPRRDPVDSALYELDADALALAIRAAGVIVHADAVSREIQAPRVAMLRQRLGSDLYALALTHRDVARGCHSDNTIGEDLDAFEARIERDGQRCLRAWAQTQPATLRAWLELGWLGKLPADFPPEQASAPDQAGAESEGIDSVDRIDTFNSFDDNADAGEIVRLAATYLFSRSASSDRGDRQGGES